MSLYLTINFLVIIAPFLLSFDKRVAFYKKWPEIIKSILIIASVFILGDILYTYLGFWGFNEVYLSGISIFNLPLEEILFFITIPYACLFIYESDKRYFPELNIIIPFVLLIYFLLGVFLVIMHFDKMYSVVTGLFSIGLAIYLWLKKPKYLAYLALMLIIANIPFCLVNGVLTGSFIEGEIVWYNPEAISNIRIFTIPIEDFSYSFNLLVLNVIVYEKLLSK